MNETLKTIKNRRSCRFYKSEQVPRELVSEILESALCGPSGRNQQGCLFTAVQDEEILKDLDNAVRVAYKEMGDSRGDNENYHFFYNAPTLIIVTAEKDYPYFFTDGSAALENMFLAATSLDLGSCWINQLKDTCDNVEVRKILDRCNIPSSHGVIGSASIGYAAKESVKPKRVENRAQII